jgi:hypothetical protein
MLGLSRFERRGRSLHYVEAGNREKHGRVRRLVGLDRILVNDVG